MNTDSKIIVAIDGYSSTGKSTMAKWLASEVGYRYIDSGAMYRAVTLYALRGGIIGKDKALDMIRLVKELPSINIDFRRDDSGQLTILNGENVEREIRMMEVSSHVSIIAAVPEVRHRLVAMQRALGDEGGIVMDGRDIGTTVFPAASLKIFVTSSPEVRADRRYKELIEKGEKVTYEDVLANVIERDRIDETRKESPLRKADDALLIDNSFMTRDEQNSWLLTRFNEALQS
ncbi:MAG: (d)CMP kinase [Muribaculaceae bacterium]|nr:(d)CMP kinase [Muribaculaceae bacterium]